MTTMAAMRARVRARLEEASAGVWSDAELDECVTGALEAYGWRFPIEAVASVAVGEGATSAALPAGALETRRVVLTNGTVVPRRGAPRDTTAGEELAWEVFAGSLRFARPLAAQNLSVWHTASPALADVPLADEGLLTLGAVAQALELRAVEVYKRGGGDTAGADVTVARAWVAFERALDRRGRRLRAVVASGP